MPTFELRTEMPATRDALFAYHARPGALARLVPPWQPVRVLENDGPLRDGKRVVMETKIGPVWKRWVAEHFDFAEGRRFRDLQTEGPFKAWTHTHDFADANPSAGANGVLTDHVEYELPFGALGRLGAHFVRGELGRMFAFRHARTVNDLRNQSYFADRPRLRVAVSGAGGAVASNLIPFLTTAGHAVSRIVRGAVTNGDDVAWTPATGELDRARLGRCDAIVHLAGRNIATRWTAAAKREITDSRVAATRGLCEALAAMPADARPRVLVAASAVGWYGDRGEETLDAASPDAASPDGATSPRGVGFAAGLCEAWERATDPARDAGVRVVNLRIGVVLSANSGAVAKMLPPARLGLAGPMGTGAQWVPWLAMDDLVYAIHAALFDDALAGPVDAVTDSVRQREFAAALGRVLRRPAVVPMPAAVVRALFGQMGDELLLASARVQPGLPAHGGGPTFGTVEGALRFELGRT